VGMEVGNELSAMRLSALRADRCVVLAVDMLLGEMIVLGRLSHTRAASCGNSYIVNSRPLPRHINVQ